MKWLNFLLGFVGLIIAVTADSASGNKEESVQIERRFWQNDFDQPHNFNCPDGQSVRRIQSEHHSHFEDRRWLWSCEADGAVPKGTNQYWSDFVNGFDGTVNFNCQDGYIVSGTYSVHDSHFEDRRYKYRCSKLAESCIMSNCHHTAYLNALDNNLDFSVPRGSQLKGLWSQHDNHFEDRVWMASICDVRCKAPTYSVYSVDWDTSGLSMDVQPQALSTQRISNPTGATVTTTVQFNEKRTVTERTSWTNSFESSVTFSRGVQIEIFSASTELTLSYGLTHEKESTVTTEKSFTKSFQVTVPPNTSVEVQLVVKKKDDAIIPFTATLKRVLNGETTIVRKTGTWKGVLYTDDTVKVVPLGHL